MWDWSGVHLRCSASHPSIDAASIHPTGLDRCADGDCHADVNGDRYLDAHGDANTHLDAYADTYAHRHTYRDAVTYDDSDGDTQPYANH
jgi:hypothetical protein